MKQEQGKETEKGKADGGGATSPPPRKEEEEEHTYICVGCFILTLEYFIFHIVKKWAYFGLY